MSGLARICKQFGKLTVKGNKGNTAEWEYDYENNEAILKSVKQGSKEAEEIHVGKREGKTLDDFLNELS